MAESWDEGLSNNFEATESESLTHNLHAQTDIVGDTLTAMELVF